MGGSFIYIGVFPVSNNVLWVCAFKLGGVKEIVEGNTKPITEQLDGDNTRIMAVAINDIF